MISHNSDAFEAALRTPGPDRRETMALLVEDLARGIRDGDVVMCDWDLTRRLNGREVVIKAVYRR